MFEDVALQRTERGKFTFSWNEAGDVLFDDRAEYPVLTTLLTRKGEYYWDEEGTQGTLLHTLKRDQFTTGSKLRSYAQDGGQQVIAAGYIRQFSAKSIRFQSGRFELEVLFQSKRHPDPLLKRVNI